MPTISDFSSYPFIGNTARFKMLTGTPVQQWAVPQDGFYNITLKGAGGGGTAGYATDAGGPGVVFTGIIPEAVTQGTWLYIVVGQQGERTSTGWGSGGCGGSFVFQDSFAKPLFIAGGGGGAGASTAYPSSSARAWSTSGEAGGGIAGGVGGTGGSGGIGVDGGSNGDHVGSGGKGGSTNYADGGGGGGGIRDITRVTSPVFNGTYTSFGASAWSAGGIGGGAAGGQSGGGGGGGYSKQLIELLLSTAAVRWHACPAASLFRSCRSC